MILPATTAADSPYTRHRGRVQMAASPNAAWLYVCTQMAFNETIDLMEEFVRLSQQLLTAPGDSRNDQLRLGLDAINAQFLPTQTAYMPIGNPFNRYVCPTPYPLSPFAFRHCMVHDRMGGACEHAQCVSSVYNRSQDSCADMS